MVSASDTFTRTVASGLGTSTSGHAWTATGIWSTNGTEAQAAVPTANYLTVPTLASAGARDVDVRLTVWPTVAATGAALVYGVMLRSTDYQNTLVLSIEFSTAGLVDAKIRSVVNNVFVSTASAMSAGSYIANEKWRMRARAVGSSVQLKIWNPADPTLPDADEPDEWTVTTTDSTATGAGFGLYMWRLSGNTNAGTVNFKADSLSIEALEFAGSVVRWPVQWDKSGNNCWAPIQAAGIMRRLRQGSQVLKSPLTQQLATYDLTGYWPLEDGSAATSFGAASTGTTPATFTPATVTPGADTTLPGSSRCPVFTTANATIRGRAAVRQTGTGFAFMFLMKLGTLPTTRTKIASISAVGGPAGVYDIYLDSSGTQIVVEAISQSGVLLSTATGGITVDPLNWVAYQLETEKTAPTTVIWTMLWHEVGEITYYFVNGSDVSASTPRALNWILGGTDLNGAAYSQVWLGENTLPFVDDTFSLVSDGYRGELASDRIQRICDQQGVPVSVESGDSEALGPQPISDLMGILEDAANADYGILYESGAGLGYRPRSARYSRDVTFALSVADGEIDDPPEAIEDDQRVRNEWTVSRTDGSSATAIDATHQAAEGRYADAVTIGVASDSVLADHAAWRVYLGTRPDLRWPDLSINFARNPELLDTWRSAPFQPRITVVTGLDQITAAADPDVIAEGYSATLSAHEWRVRFNCSSAGGWDVPELDGEARLDTDGSELASSVTTTATSWSVSTTSDPVWITSAAYPGDFPFSVTCEGEEVTVTAITGTSSPQTFTVTRSVNGVVKAHSAGAELSLTDPTYLAL
jgi:hypothetical protein